MLKKKDILKNLKKEKYFSLISNLSEKLNIKSYVIGGYVRDLLLNKNQPIDIDIVTTGNSLILAKMFYNSISKKVIYVFKKFKTAIVKNRNIRIEFVSTRKEYYNIYDNKPYVKIFKTIKEDQKRRDFTINTIAISLNKNDFGKILDPFNGIKDIKNKIIKTPINPNITFYDDPLRMIRAIRFKNILRFKIDKSLIKSIQENIDRIKIVSIERIVEEFNKILLSNKPSIGLKLMYKFGFLFYILPDFISLKGRVTFNGYSYKDNFIHSLKVLDNISKLTNNLWLRWATLLHDIGKNIAKKFIINKGWTFYKHEIIGSNMIPYIFHKLKLSLKSNMKYVQTIVRYSNLPIILYKKKKNSVNSVKISTIRKYIYKIGLNNIVDLIKLCYCDITTIKETKRINKKKIINFYKITNKIENKYQISNLKMPINGHDIMNYFKIKPSKIVGKIKNIIKDYIVKGKILNDYKEAFKLMKKIGKKILKRI
ncbi:MAG: HD domain-containing protein [Candidatus Shikimatogenerans bostrichidophilus]|nr:MAG: HD domain-containing protein [Candidatus Shikimatogenerans bostrichidophilus]